MANDKLMHFGAGALISYVGEEDGFLMSCIAGALKEGYDELNGGRFDPMDMLATAAGGAVVQLAKYGHLRVSDNFLRFASWSLMGYSCASVATQQRNGMYEVNPLLTSLTGEHPSFGQVALINLGWNLGAEYAYRHWGPGYGRAMWILGAVGAAYWIARDYNEGIDGPEISWRVSIVLKRF